MTIPHTTPTRKEKFDAALKLAGMTIEDFKRDIHPVSQPHLYLVLTGERKPSALLDRVITEFIDAQFSRITNCASCDARNDGGAQ